MFCFERGYLLYALCLLPVFICFYIWKIKKQKAIIRRYGDEKLLGGLMPGLSYGMKNLKFILCCLIYACLIFTIANPQLGSGVEKGKRRGVDLMFCIDVSNSMLARDYAPNRLVSVKQGMMSLLDKLGGDRIGLVVFAGKSFVQLPITSDYAAAKMFMSNISTRSVSEQGTDLAGAIDKAAVSMLTEGSEDKTNRSGISKVMIIVSDGEDHAEDAVDMAKAAAERGISIYTLGIGSEEGEPIPIGNSQGVTTYKKDKDGNTVITRLNSDLLKEIAAAGKGKYIHASNAVVSFDKLYETINSMDKADIEDIVYTRYNTMFYVPLIIAIILLCIEFLLMNKKMLTLSKIPYLNKKIVCFLLLSIFVSLSVNAQTSKEMKYIRQGNRE